MAAEPVRKPDIRELVGIAVNTSALQFKERAETPLDRVAGIGAAMLAVTLGVDREDLPIAAAKTLIRSDGDVRIAGDLVDPRDVLHAELSRELLHILEGDRRDSLPKAIALFSEWITYRKLFAEQAGTEHHQLRRAFASWAMHEWLSFRCTACGGTGREERLRNGSIVRSQARGQRNATFVQCRSCTGNGHATFGTAQRMKALGLTREAFDTGRWDQRFAASRSWLNQLLPNRLMRVLTAELERRKRRV